ncbi:MAG: alpha-E domain-containing protein, partial [Dehalococcoidia bacterium]|nr:alpha-E domain-containing protein [Dehalococcoidia bacterium]
MLSRVANALYSMGRQLERAEHVARLLDVHTNLSLDLPPDEKTRVWKRLLAVSHVSGPVLDEGTPIDLATVGHLLAAHDDNDSSVINCIVAAREHARGVRESISSEMWEQLNRLHWQTQTEVAHWQDNPHQFFQSVKNGCHLFNGLADETMSHDEGWQFFVLGKFFERVVNTTRLVDYVRAELGSGENDDPIEWAAVLKACSAYEAYRRGRGQPVESRSVIQFLLFHPVFPRSALYGATQIAQSVYQIGPGNLPLGSRAPTVDRLAGRLRSTLEFAD